MMGLRELVLTINGEVHHVPGPSTVRQLLSHLGLDPRSVVVEVNRRIVRRPDLERTPLNNGDLVELVHFVGGG